MGDGRWRKAHTRCESRQRARRRRTASGPVAVRDSAECKQGSAGRSPDAGDDACTSGAARVTDPALRDLADCLGVAAEWTDFAGKARAVSVPALRRILTVLGYPCE